MIYGFQSSTTGNRNRQAGLFAPIIVTSALFALTACGSDSSSSTPELCSPTCGSNESCVDGVCREAGGSLDAESSTPDASVSKKEQKNVDHAPASGSDLNCVDILKCVSDAECPDEKDSCYRQKCVNHGTDNAQNRFLAFVRCFRDNGCTDASDPKSCLNQNCQNALQKCVATAQPGTSQSGSDSSSNQVGAGDCQPNLVNKPCFKATHWNDDASYSASGIQNEEGSAVCGHRGADPNYGGLDPDKNFHWGNFSYTNECGRPVHIRSCVYVEHALLSAGPAWWCNYKTNVAPGQKVTFGMCYNHLGPDTAGVYLKGNTVTPASNPAGCVKRCPDNLQNCSASEISNQ